MKKRPTKAERMALDETPWDEDEDPAARRRERQELIYHKLKDRPTGFLVDRLGARHCLLTKSPPPVANTKDDNARQSLGVALTKPKQVSCAKDEDEVHQWMAAVHEHSPWMGPVSVHVMENALRRVRSGTRVIGFDPVLVHGEPGIGKTHYARALADSMGLPVLVLDGASMISGFQVSGLERGWSGACASPIVRLIAETGIANPVVIVDEADKIPPESARGGTAHHALLGMMEPVSAGRWRCPYTEMVLDLRGVSWFLTANDPALVAAPLKDRCRVIRAQAPTAKDVDAYVRARMRGHSPEIVHLTAKAAAGKSLRKVGRIVDAVIAAGSRPILN